MKRLMLTFVVLLALSGRSAASTDFTTLMSGRNIMQIGEVQKYGYGCEVKTDFLFFILHELNRRFFSDTTSVQLQFNVYRHVFGDRVYAYKRKYSLGYYPRQIENFAPHKEPPGYSKRNCLVLNCISEDVSTKECLKLIYFGLRNAERLQKLQRPIYAADAHHLVADPLRRPYGWSYHNTIYGPIDFVRTISDELIDSVLKAEFPEINELVQCRFYESWLHRNSKWKIDYYTQNDSIYFIRGKGPKIVLFKEYPIDQITDQIKEITAHPPKSEELLFKCKDITQVETDYDDNYFIFVNDSTAYYYNAATDVLQGPTKVPAPEEIHGDVEFFRHVAVKDGNRLSIMVEARKIWYELIYNRVKHEFYLDTSGMLRSLRERAREQEKIANERSKPNYNLPDRYRNIFLIGACIILLTFALTRNKVF